MTKKKKARRQRQRAANTAKQDPEGLQHHGQPAAAANTADELDSLHQHAGRLSLDDACHHGLDLTSGPYVTLFLKQLREICDEWTEAKDDAFGDNQISHLYLVFMSIKEACKSGILCRLELRVHDIRVMIQVFTSWGVEYLTNKAASRFDIYQIKACSMGMLVHVVSTYFTKAHGKSFQSYFISLDFDEIIFDDDYSRFIGSFTFAAARVFSPRVTCSCIPTYMACCHGFSATPDDPIYSFITSYICVTLEAIKRQKGKGKIDLPGVLNFIQDKLDERSVFHWLQMRQLRTKALAFLTAYGTDLFLGGSDAYSLTVVFIKHVEEMQASDEPHDLWRKRQADFMRFISDHYADPKRKASKFLLLRIKDCSCLKKVCEELKHGAKKGMCANCFETMDRREIKTCQQCHCKDYCSRSCQVAHWPIHKCYCREIAGERKEISWWKTTDRPLTCEEFVDAGFYEQKLQSDNDA